MKTMMEESGRVKAEAEQEYKKEQQDNMALMKTMLMEMGKKKEPSLVDTRGIGKPPTFKGQADKYPERMAKLLAYLRVIKKESDSWIIWAVAEPTLVNDESMDCRWGDLAPDVKSFSHQLFSTLITNCEDDAFKLIQSAGTGNGMEALRLLGKRYDPKNPGTKRSLLKSLLNIQPCAKVGDLEKSIMKIEELIKKYENMTDANGKIPDDLVATIMISVCHKELREHLELSTQDLSRDRVRTEIFNYIERKRTQINEDFAEMELDNLEGEHNWNFYDDYGYQGGENETYEELNYFGGKGGKSNWGGKNGFGKGGKSYFGGKGGKGGFGGKSNSGGKFGGGKGGEWGGKGKGKDIVCYWCNQKGHTQMNCRQKDAYMDSVRARNGETSGGAKDAHQMGCCVEDPKKPKEQQQQQGGNELSGMEAQARSGQTYRYISSFEMHNPFKALEVSEADFPAVPPGLSSQVSKPKMPMWKKVNKPKLKEISMIMRKGPKELMNFEHKGGEEYIEATIDSGASDSVANVKHASVCKVVPSPGSMEGVKYISASGNVIDNVGEKHVQVETNSGRKRTLNLQIADVTRVLLSVSKICDAGNVVTFTQNGGKITNTETGEVDHFERREDVYRMKLKVIGDGSLASGFTRPGM